MCEGIILFILLFCSFGAAPFCVKFGIDALNAKLRKEIEDARFNQDAPVP